MKPERLLVPIDFSSYAEHALDYACALAQQLDATVHLVNALGGMLPEIPPAVSGTRLDEMIDRHHTELARLADARRTIAKIGSVRVKEGDPRDVIFAAIDELDVDLVVMATHGRRGIGRLVIGSVAEDIARRARCPVLLVRGPTRRSS